MNFNNNYHLGDCVFSIIYFNKVCRTHCDLEINFYCNISYHWELTQIIEFPDRIHLFPYEDKGESTWINREGFYHGNGSFKGKFARMKYYDEIYIYFYNYLSKICDIDFCVHENIDTLYDSNLYLEGIEDFANSYEYLVVNSEPLSKQFVHDPECLNQIIIDLSKQYNVITTKKIDGIDCTLDNQYSLLDIGRISYFIKRFICIHTAPHILTLNKFNHHNIEQWICLHNRHSINFNFVKSFKSHKELQNFLDPKL